MLHKQCRRCCQGDEHSLNAQNLFSTIYFVFSMKERQMITNVLRVTEELLSLSKRVQVCVCVCRIELTSRCLPASAQPGKTHSTKRQNTDECSSAGRGAHIPAHTYSNIILHTRFHNQAHGRAGGGAGGGTLHWTYLFKNKNRRRLKCHFFLNPL